MAKYGALWDDSVLVKALDDAVSKYKIMHGKGEDKGSLKEENFIKGTEERAPNIVDGNNEGKSVCMETLDKTTDVPKNTAHTGAVDSSVNENCHSEIEQYMCPSNGVQVQDTDGTFVIDESAEDYNSLLNQYNAVEEQRQKLLERLYQYGHWDNQGYAYGATYDSQYHPEPAPQPSGPPICSCRPYVCPYSTTPYTSLATVTSCETCAGSTALAQNESSNSLEDHNLIKAAMGAVDRAIHSFNQQTSGISEIDKEGKKSQEVETGSGNVAKDKTSQTELSVVLNAWFSAGFYTGKYLSEQASAKK